MNNPASSRDRIMQMANGHPLALLFTLSCQLRLSARGGRGRPPRPVLVHLTPLAGAAAKSAPAYVAATKAREPRPATCACLCSARLSHCHCWRGGEARASCKWHGGCWWPAACRRLPGRKRTTRSGRVGSRRVRSNAARRPRVVVPRSGVRRPYVRAEYTPCISGEKKNTCRF